MTAASYEVCAPWATAADVAGNCCKGGMSDTTLATDAFLTASSILYELSGRRWPGVCTDTVRPTAEHASVGGYTPALGGVGGGAPFYGMFPGIWGWCGCDQTQIDGCASVSEIRLPGYPVVEIDEVKVDGVVWPATYYRVQDRSKLLLVPSAAPSDGWPCHQDVTLDDDQVGTWSVVYKWGAGPPRAGVRSAATLGCELYKSWAGSTEGCALPERVTSIVRQGVTIALLDTFDIFEKGLTGINSIDLWLSSLGRGNAQATSAVLVPDQLPTYRRDNP